MTAPFKPVDFLPRDIDVERRSDGTIVLHFMFPHLIAFLGAPVTS